MIYSRVSIDYDSLPTALLPELKAWARVDHNDDDAILSSQLSMALAHLEKISDLSVFAAKIVATPTVLDRARYLPPYLRPNVNPAQWMNLVRMPHFPISEVVNVAEDDSETPYSGTILVVDPDYGPTFLDYPPSGVRYGYTAGYETAAEVPPLVKRYALRLASSLYENREAAIDTIAETFSVDFFPLWRPSA